MHTDPPELHKTAHKPASQDHYGTKLRIWGREKREESKEGGERWREGALMEEERRCVFS